MLRRLTSIVLALLLEPILPGTPVPDLEFRVPTSWPGLPFIFEENRGQADTPARFVGRGDGFTLLFAPTEAVISLPRSSATSIDRRSGATTSDLDRQSSLETESVRMKFVGARPETSVVGVEQLSARSHYFVGNNPSEWRTDIPTYAKVRYEEIYPSVDLIFYGSRELEHDFIVAPGGNPSTIQVEFEGVEGLQLDPHGDLILETWAGVLRQRKPVMYQTTGGIRHEVPGGYVLGEGRRLGFWVSEYDRDQPLIIDPVLLFSTPVGGSQADSATDLAVDPSGNVYLAGLTFSTNFPTAGALQPSKAGGSDAFVVKLTPTGSVAFSTYFGGNGDEAGDARPSIAVDSAGFVYIAGETRSADFPVVQPFSPGCITTGQAFVTKLSPTGNQIVYSSCFGGADWANDIAVDQSSNVYLTGRTRNFRLSPVNAFQPTAGSLEDGFISKLHASGTFLLYSSYLGGNNDDEAWAIAVDALGNAYIGGVTTSSSFPSVSWFTSRQCGAGVPAGGFLDAFVTKVSATGISISYSGCLGGSGNDGASGLGVDLASNVYVTGGTASSDFPTTAGAFQVTRGGPNDGFVTKISPSGTAVAYSTLLGGGGADGGTRIAVDRSGNAYVGGSTNSADFPVRNAFQATRSGLNDAFVARISPSGTALVFSSYLGGSGTDDATGIAVDPLGNAFISGTTTSADFPAVRPLFTYAGAGDGFVTRVAAFRTAGDFDADGRADIGVYRSVICLDPPSCNQVTAWWIVTGQPVTTFGLPSDIPVTGDYNGDLRTEVALFRPSTGQWLLAGQASIQWGAAGDIPAPADFNGDGRTDVAVFRPGNGTWFVRGLFAVSWGAPGDIPVPSDYSGDGVADVAVYRRSSGTWFIQGRPPISWGAPGDIPVPADYDGDGRSEFAVFRPSTGQWFVNGLFTVYWGAVGDVPLPIDVTGDRRADLCVYRPETASFLTYDVAANSSVTQQHGTLGDLPVHRRPELPSQVIVDFDGDGSADPSVYRPSNGSWYTLLSSTALSSSRSRQWGITTDKPVPGDYRRFGRNQPAVYRPSNGTWYVADGPQLQWGVSSDLPVQGDYDGDRQTDIAVYRPASGIWYVLLSSTTYARHLAIQWGLGSDLPVPSDYDGDGRTDIAVYRPSNGTWYVSLSSSNFTTSRTVSWGVSADIPVIGDYDGDRQADPAVFRPSNGVWYVLLSSTAFTSSSAVQWGLASDVPVPADFNADGHTDIAVFRPSAGSWFVRNQFQAQWGASGDTPLPRLLRTGETTVTGFFYPTGSSELGVTCGTWLGRDEANGGCYFDGFYHIGRDIMAAEGSPVYAIADGTVTHMSATGWGDDNVGVVVRHRLADGTSFLALYGHIRTDVVVGSPVAGGMEFARVGPWADGTHVHFGIHPDLTMPSSNWGLLPNSSWPDLNGFVDPIAWITTRAPYRAQIGNHRRTRRRYSS